MTLSPDELQQLEQAKNRYAEIKAQCEAQVVRWEWADFTRYDLRPFYFERHRFHRGNVLEDAPDRVNGLYQYGFDAEGRIVVERNYIDTERMYEEFFVHSANAIDAVHYDYSPNKPIISVTHQRTENGKPSELTRIFERGTRLIERYSYEDGKLTNIRLEHADKLYDELISYNNDGQLALLTSVDESGNRHTMYRRPAPDQTIERLSKEMIEILVRLIPSVVQSAQIAEPVYCLALSWSPQPGFLPPWVTVGLESTREEMLSNNLHQDFGWEFPWLPSEQANPLGHLREVIREDKAASEIADLLDQEIFLQDRWADGEALLFTLADRLNALDWSQILPTTSDFVAYAVEEEMHHLSANLKRVATPEMLAQWESLELYVDEG